MADDATARDATARDRPYLRLVRGDASPEEVAAIVAVLAAHAVAATVPAPRRPTSAWADPSRSLRHGVAPAPGAWRRSGHAAGTRTRADW